MHQIIVIGAGLAGTLTALELSKNYKVLLIEAGTEIIPTTSSSFNECYKLHTGVHYIGDKKTAEHCLRKAVEFARLFPNYIAGGNDLFSPWRRGRHYIMENSMVTKEQAQEIARHVQQVYQALIEEDGANKVFGEVEDFIKFLEPADYPYIAEAIPFYDAKGQKTSTKVVSGIETAESQIDIYALKEHLKALIASNANIQLITSARVVDLQYCSDQYGYQITLHKPLQGKSIIEATCVVNCSWQNIETLDNKLGLYTPDEKRINRIKVSVLVTLPDALKSMNTCIFSSGPYCSITVLPNGNAILTSERITNIGYYQAGTTPSPEIQALLTEVLTLESTRGRDIAKNIIDDCAGYLTSFEQALMREAKILELHVGFVKLMNLTQAYNQQSIYDTQSDIHARQEDGIEIKELGYISNSGMKMTYTVGNAYKIQALMEQQLELIRKAEALIERTKTYLEPRLLNKKAIDSLLYITLRPYIINLLKDTTKLLDECALELSRSLTASVSRQRAVNAFFLKPNTTKVPPSEVDKSHSVGPILT